MRRMDNRSLRIGLLLLVIYLAGLATGRYLTPPKTEVTFSGGASPLAASDRFSSSRLIELLKIECHITPQQADKIRPIISRWREEALKLPPNSRPQIELWEVCAAKVGMELTPEQLPIYQKMVEDQRRRIARRFRN